jgi:hypothetical protein
MAFVPDELMVPFRQEWKIGRCGET